MGKYLVVANKTLGGARLRELLGHLVEDGGTVHAVVPSTAPSPEERTWLRAEHIDVPRGDTPGMVLALWCLRQVLSDWAMDGIEATGEVGDANPFEAVADAMRREPYDAIIVSTLPARVSRWLAMDLPGRLRRVWDVPVLHLERKGPRVDLAAARLT